MIRLTNVSKTYQLETALTVLKGVSLHVAENEFVAILGASGSGKSTLLHIMGLLDQLSTGRIVVNGQDVSRFTEEELARFRSRHIGFVFQAFHLVPHLSVVENVELPLFYQRLRPHERRRRAAASLERVQMGHRLHHRPSQLSGGECQRTSIARALVSDPDLILADEPTGNLDSRTGSEVFGVFKDLHQQGRTVVVITHDNEIADQVPRVIRIADGRIEEDTAACT